MGSTRSDSEIPASELEQGNVLLDIELVHTAYDQMSQNWPCRFDRHERIYEHTTERARVTSKSPSKILLVFDNTQSGKDSHNVEMERTRHLSPKWFCMKLTPRSIRQVRRPTDKDTSTSKHTKKVIPARKALEATVEKSSKSQSSLHVKKCVQQRKRNEATYLKHHPMHEPDLKPKC